ncbi:MAG: hypothetical protein WC375_05410 [Methanomassiliicoccales archaeon]|jgi:hypothetical protein
MKNLVYLVINENYDSKFAPFSEKYRIFLDPDKAINHATSLGMEGITGDFKFNLKEGILNQYREGNEINISLIAIEVQS